MKNKIILLKYKLSCHLLFIYFVVFVLLVAGWVMNLLDIIGIRHSDAFTIEIILRVLGIFFFPLGGIMGWV